MKKQLLTLVAAFSCGFVAVVGGLLAYQKLNAPLHPPEDLPLLWPNPKQLGAFELSDQHEAPFNLDSVTGKWTFWFFGYTNCPDVCPVTLTVMNQVDEQLVEEPALRERTQYVFVSVDPQRDSLERIGKYVSFFNPSITGATAPDEALESLTKQFGILYLRQDPDASGNYLVDHTAGILLTDPQARFVALFSAPHDAQALSEMFKRIEAFLNS